MGTELLEGEDDRPEVKLLLSNIKKEMASLTQLLDKCNEYWCYEDAVYRFYHQGRKAFYIMTETVEIVEKLKSLLPDHELNELFKTILAEGTGHDPYKRGDGANRPKITRAILEAFFHARYFLEMAVKYGKEQEYPPKILPVGWAALLYLYNLQ